MKCEIIKDILPLYIESLCSAESKKEVEEHLEHCSECRQEYLELRQDYISHTDNENIENFLGEKHLLEKSKQELKGTFVIYHYRYPRFYFNALGGTQIWILILPFLPTILAIIGSAAIHKFKKHKIFSRIILLSSIPAIFLGGFCTLIFMVIPPISSTTNNLSDYMKIDGDIGQFENSILNFYPDEIPANAKQAEYFYQRYTSFFAEDIDMEASWVLPPSDYDTIKQQTLELSPFKNSTLSESGGSGTILSTILPENVTIIFEYNDSIKRVSYRAYANRKY